MLPVKVGVSPLNWENGQVCSSAAAAAKGFLSAGGNRRANQEEASSELCLFVTERSLSVPSELPTEEWAQPRPSEGAEEPARRQQTAAAREDDSDTELTYGEVEQRLDLLQQHLNR